MKSEGMLTVVGDDHALRCPNRVRDLATFRTWAYSQEVPEKLRICYLDGEVWIDMSREELFSHNQVKLEFGIVITALLRSNRIGRFSPDGILFFNASANLAAAPDGMYVAHETVRCGRFQFVQHAKSGFVELEGTPDMVLEVVSDGSEAKDEVKLRDLYWKAGIPEYWLVDARGDEIRFEILRRTSKGYKAVRKQGGWIKSSVFSKSFKLTRQDDALGHPEYTLAVR